MGGFAIRWTNILIGIQSSLIVLPINLFIVFLFRRAAPSKEKETNDRVADDDEDESPETVNSNTDPLNALELNKIRRPSAPRGDGSVGGSGNHGFVDYTESGGLGVSYGGHRYGDMISKSVGEINSPLRPKMFAVDSSKSFDESVFQIKNNKFFTDDESSFQMKEVMNKGTEDVSCPLTQPQRKDEEMVSIDDIDISTYRNFFIIL